MHELKATSAESAIRKASNVSDSGYKEVPYPDCLKKDLATLRMELQDMKVDLTSRINNLKLVSSPLEGFHQISSTVDKVPIWVPFPPTGERLPTVGERSKSLTSGGCTSYGNGAAEVTNAAKHYRTGDVPNTTDQCVEDSGMNP